VPDVVKSSDGWVIMISKKAGTGGENMVGAFYRAKGKVKAHWVSSTSGAAEMYRGLTTSFLNGWTMKKEKLTRDQNETPSGKGSNGRERTKKGLCSKITAGILFEGEKWR